MIRIIKGSYGLKVGKSIKPVRAGDAPISLEAKQEERLVKLGVAEYVKTAEAVSEPAPAEKKAKTKKKTEVVEEAEAESVEEAAEEELPEVKVDDTVYE